MTQILAATWERSAEYLLSMGIVIKMHRHYRIHTGIAGLPCRVTGIQSYFSASHSHDGNEKKAMEKKISRDFLTADS